MADINLSKIWNISTKNLSYESNQTVLQNRVQPSKISSKFCTSNLTFENHVPSNRYPWKLTWMICYLNGRVNLVFKKKRFLKSTLLVTYIVYKTSPPNQRFAEKVWKCSESCSWSCTSEKLIASVGTKNMVLKSLVPRPFLVHQTSAWR